MKEQLTGSVTHIVANGDAMAAIKENGAVVTWAHTKCGGDSSAVKEQLTQDVVNITSCTSGFVACKADGRSSSAAFLHTVADAWPQSPARRTGTQPATCQRLIMSSRRLWPGPAASRISYAWASCNTERAVLFGNFLSFVILLRFHCILGSFYSYR